MSYDFSNLSLNTTIPRQTEVITQSMYDKMFLSNIINTLIYLSIIGLLLWIVYLFIQKNKMLYFVSHFFIMLSFNLVFILGLFYYNSAWFLLPFMINFLSFIGFAGKFLTEKKGQNAL